MLVRLVLVGVLVGAAACGSTLGAAAPSSTLAPTSPSPTSGEPSSPAPPSVGAGGDVVLTIRESDVAEMTAELQQAASQSPEFFARLQASVHRVLASKVAAGLVHC